ncbi:MAG: hypothetical protein N2749_01160 [Clostridia bacterium]|nr:hypothetical protein [Clostridia bacterium]
MKRRNLIVCIVIIVAIIIYCLNNNSSSNSNKSNNSSQDNLTFKSEYEALNGAKNEDGTNKYLAMNLPEQNLIEYITIDEVFNILNGGTGIIYFGMPECPWCRNMLPVLINSAKSNGIDTIYYYNPKKIRDENSEEYQKLVDILKEFLLTDTTTQKETDQNFSTEKKRIYMPDVFFVKNGKIVGDHKSTVSSQKDPKIELTDEQYNELLNIYNGYIKKINSTCNDSSGVCK